MCPSRRCRSSSSSATGNGSSGIRFPISTLDSSRKSSGWTADSTCVSTTTSMSPAGRSSLRRESAAFPNYPTVFSSLPLELVSHSSERVNRDLGRFAGRRVVVVGAGQSALESAALLSEAGAQVEILARQPNVRWLRSSSWLEWLMDCKVNPFKVPGKIGPIGINWLVENPRLFTAFPRRLQDKMTARAIRPAGSSWLRPRTTEVTFQTGRHVVSAMRQGDQVRLELNDGTHASRTMFSSGRDTKSPCRESVFCRPICGRMCAPQMAILFSTGASNPLCLDCTLSVQRVRAFIRAAVPLCGRNFLYSERPHGVRPKKGPRPRLCKGLTQITVQLCDFVAERLAELAFAAAT